MHDMQAEGRGLKTIRPHRTLFLVEGLILLVLGAAAILLPFAASLAVTIFFGWLLMVGGLVGLVATFSASNAPGFIWSLISALIALIAGAVLAFMPLTGMLSLTMVLAAFLAADGVVMVFYALEHRRHSTQRWVFVLINGLLDLILAGLIVWFLPGAAAWILGLLLGIDLIFAGFSLIALALASRWAH